MFDSFYFNIGPGYPVQWQMYFQFIHAPAMYGISHFHDDLMAIMLGILTLVIVLYYKLLFTFNLGDWIFQVDLDRRVDPQFKKAMLEFMAKNKDVSFLNFSSVIIKHMYAGWFDLKQVSFAIFHKFLEFADPITLRIKKFFLSKYDASTWLEIFWTIIPGCILVVIGLPSFALLYALDECFDPVFTVQAVGHQWYWSYESTDFPKPFNFDSYMVAEDDLSYGGLRLLEVDKPLYLPIRTNVRVLTSSTDVIHSWAVPSLGIKMDACPGRLNQVPVFLDRKGSFHGQCSEICGVNHAFMPIVIKGVSLKDYCFWLKENFDIIIDRLR